MRPATAADAADLAELFGSVEEALLGRLSRLDENAVRGWFDEHSWLLEEDGALVAGAFARLRGSLGVSAGAVRLSAQGRGLGSRLAELAEVRLATEGADWIHAWTLAADTAASDLFRRRGYREVRRFWEMAVGLGEEPPAPDIPVEAFREEDAPAFHAALEEAFADHWEHRPEPFEEWWGRQRRWPSFDPSAWFVVRDGSEIAGVARNDLDVAGGGHVGALGVRPAWRGRGYGRALLLHSFREFRRRGMTRAALRVDAANATGATYLYESAGMQVEQENIVWERSLS